MHIRGIVLIKLSQQLKPRKFTMLNFTYINKDKFYLYNVNEQKINLQQALQVLQKYTII